MQVCIISDLYFLSSLFERLTFFFFVRLNLSLDRFPVDLYLGCILFHTLICLFFVVLLQEALSVRYDRVNMRFVADSNVKSPIPSVELDVELNSSVE